MSCASRLGQGTQCEASTQREAGTPAVHHTNASLLHGATSLDSVELLPAYWRLSGTSTILYPCATVNGSSSCIGGTYAGDENEFKPEYTGSGYCLEGHTGPMCQVCMETGTYYEVELARCSTCPVLTDSMQLPIIGLCLLLVLLLGFKLVSRWIGGCKLLVAPIALGRRAADQLKEVDIVPRFKLVFTFFQLASQLTTTYNVKLSGRAAQLYTDSVSIFSWASVNLDDYFYPGQCIKAGFKLRLLIRGIWPVILLVAIPLCATLYFYCRRTRGAGKAWLSNALLVALPFDLMVSFVLCPTVSKGIFGSFNCVEFDLGGEDTRTFLAEDLLVVCSASTLSGEYPAEYSDIRTIAGVFVLLWPIGMPLIYLLALLPLRKDLRQKRKTKLVKATAFLHKEYTPSHFWWEVLSLSQRLILTGFVLLIPIENDYWRIFLGLLVTIGYLTLLQFSHPYARPDINTQAIAAQFSLVCVFLGGAFIKLFSGGGEDTCSSSDGAVEDDSDDMNVLMVVYIMVMFNGFVLLICVVLAIHKFASSSALPSIRLVSNGNVPELKMQPEHKFHLFLSHIWSSGQDQMATVKRELQLLVPGIRVFLDVDDLEEIGDLEKYVRQTQTMLIFLSKGYFFSGNCKKEIIATLKVGNPIILLHETDPMRGGASVEQLTKDCPDEMVGGIFGQQLPIIPWLRVKEYKLISLKMIVSSMLIHQSLKKPTEKQIRKSAVDAAQIEALKSEGKKARAMCLRTAAKGGVGGEATAFEVLVGQAKESGPELTPMELRHGGVVEQKQAKVPGLTSLGSDLYVPGEVMRQSLSFLTKTTLIVSAENPGATSSPSPSPSPSPTPNPTPSPDPDPNPKP